MKIETVGEMYERYGNKTDMVAKWMHKLREAGVNQRVLRVSDKGRMVIESKVSHGYWYFFGKREWSMERRCTLWKDWFYKFCGFLPHKCLNCWKIVIRPRSFVETYQLGLWFEENTDWDGKFGFDGRDYTYDFKSVYIYCESYKEALMKMSECLGKVQEVMGELSDIIRIGDETYVIDRIWIQHACTEYNIDYFMNDLDRYLNEDGMWEVSEEEKEVQDLLEDKFYHSVPEIYPGELNLEALTYFKEKCYQFGDPTSLPFTKMKRNVEKFNKGGVLEDERVG